MPTLMHKLIRGVERHTKASQRKIRRRRVDGRRWRLIDAATQFLARVDYDSLPITKIAKEAGCSVGALYLRFRTKDDFLDAVIGETLDSATKAAKAELTIERWHQAATKTVVRAIAGEVANRTGDRRNAGVIRAAIKLGTTIPEVLKPLKEYRSTVTDCAIALLSPRLEIDNPPLVIREAMQVIFATAIDSVIQDFGPLRVGTRKMSGALSTLLMGMLDQNGPLSETAGDEAGDDKDELADREKETEEPPHVPKGHIAVFDSDLKVYRGTEKMSAKAKKPGRPQRQSPKAEPVVQPASPPRAERNNEPAASPRAKRFRLL
jgi:AcrR family transcriptional regulator